MNITIKTKNLELTPSLEVFINKRVVKLEKFFNHDSAQLRVEIEKETKHHRKGEVFCAEIILKSPGMKIVAKAKGDDMGKVITEAREDLEIEIKKHKTKKIEAPRREARKTKTKII